MRKNIFLTAIVVVLVVELAGQKDAIVKSPSGKLRTIMHKLKKFLDKTNKEVVKDKWDFIDELDEIYRSVKEELKSLRPPIFFKDERKVFKQGYTMLKKDLVRLKRIGENKNKKAAINLLRLKLNLKAGACIICHTQIPHDKVNQIWHK
ncbi:MAG: hypothetical protein ACK4NF_07585 [Planctomycetota bacterium]